MNVATGQNLSKRSGMRMQQTIQLMKPLIDVTEEIELAQKCADIRKSSEYYSNIAMSLLYDSMAAIYLQAGHLEKDKKKVDLHNQATLFIQNAEKLERSRFVGDSSEWNTKIISGMQYLAKKDEEKKAFRAFSESLELTESRAARIGLALVYLRSHKYLEALKELSKVYMSIYGAAKENVGSLEKPIKDEDKLNEEDFDNPLAVQERLWYSQQTESLKSSYSEETEMMTTFLGLRPSMALIWYKLGCTQRAIDILQMQVERVDSYLKMRSETLSNGPPGHDHTLAMLGILLINKYNETMFKANSALQKSQAAHLLNKAFVCFKEAWQINPNNPLALNHLSNMFFTQKRPEERDYARIDSFAKKAKEVSSNHFIQAESCYYLARSSHARGDYQQAYKHYLDSIKLWPNFALALFGMGQMALQNQNYSSAMDLFTKVDSKFPDLFETKAVLGHLHTKLALSNNVSAEAFADHYSKANKYIQRAIKINPTVESFIDLAQLKERNDPTEALSIYIQASEFTFESSIAIANLKKKYLENEKKNENRVYFDIPNVYSIWNNIASLRIKLELLPLAFDTLMRCFVLNLCCFDSSSSNIPNNTTIQFSISSTSNLPIDLIVQAIIKNSISEPLNEIHTATIEKLVLNNKLYLWPLNLTLGFNLGIYYENSRQFEKSLLIYNNILKKFPHYKDASLRLANVKKQLGNFEESIQILNSLMEEQVLKEQTIPYQQLAGLYLVRVYLDQKKFQESKKLLDKITKDLAASSQLNLNNWSFGSEIYALTLYANFFLETSYGAPNRDRNLKWASDLFTNVLKQSSGNIYAANGLAIISVLKGGADHHRQALNAFFSIREACPALPDVVVNLGHFYFVQNDYKNAIKFYITAISKFGFLCPQIQHGQVPMMLARAQNEIGQYEEAKKTLMKLVHNFPDVEDIWHNLAVLCKDYGLSILKKVDGTLPQQEDILDLSVPVISRKIGNSPSEEEQLAAIDALKFAGPIFGRLQNPIGKHTFSTKKCAKFATLCDTNCELAQEKLETFKLEMNRLLKIREQQLNEAKLVEQQQQLQASLEKEKENQIKTLLNQEAEQARIRNEAMLEQWAKEQLESSNTPKRRKNNRKNYDSDEYENEYQLTKKSKPLDLVSIDQLTDVNQISDNEEEDPKISAEVKRKADLLEISKKRSKNKRQLESNDDQSNNISTTSPLSETKKKPINFKNDDNDDDLEIDLSGMVDQA